MTENPDYESCGHIGCPITAWNEGYNQAIEDTLKLIHTAPDRIYREVFALRKKVGE